MTGCRAGKRMRRGGVDGRAVRLVVAAQADFYVHDAVCALSRQNPRQGCWVHYSYFRLLMVHCNFQNSESGSYRRS